MSALHHSEVATCGNMFSICWPSSMQDEHHDIEEDVVIIDEASYEKEALEVSTTSICAPNCWGILASSDNVPWKSMSFACGGWLQFYEFGTALE